MFLVPGKWRSLIARIAVGLLLLAVAVTFTDASLQTSRKIGRLSTIPNYDDVVYLNEASKIYYRGQREGVALAGAALLTQYLHAPLVVFAGLGGFLAFGPQVDQAYQMLALVVFALLAFMVAVCRVMPPVLRIAAAISALALPFATMCAQQFRPDMLWATVLGGSCVLVLGTERLFERKRTAAWVGAGLGLALLTKPSIFAMTLLVMGGAWFLAALIAAVAERVPVRRIGVHLLITMAAATAVAGWYWAQHAREIFGYFFVNSFGDNREIWGFRGSLWEQLTYYVAPGKALDSNLGHFFYPLLAVFLAGSIFDVFRGGNPAVRLRGGAFLWMLAGTCAVNAAFGMKSPFLGGSFYGFLIFGAAWNGARLVQAAVATGWLRPVWRQVVLAAALLAASATAYSYPPACRVSGKIRKVMNSVNQGVLRDLLKTSGAMVKPVLVVTQATPIVPQYLEIEFRTKGRDLTMISAALDRSVDEVRGHADHADYVLLQDEGLSGRPEGNAFPAEKLQPELLAYFQAAPDWHLVGSYDDGTGKFARLFQRNR